MVYLELQGGKERGLDLSPVRRAAQGVAARLDPDQRRLWRAATRPLALRSTDVERRLHAEFVAKTLKDKAVWLKFETA